MVLVRTLVVTEPSLICGKINNQISKLFQIIAQLDLFLRLVNTCNKPQLIQYHVLLISTRKRSHTIYIIVAPGRISIRVSIRVPLRVLPPQHHIVHSDFPYFLLDEFTVSDLCIGRVIGSITSSLAHV